MCLSIDDLPLVTYGLNDTVVQSAMFDKLVSALDRNGIPAIGFVNDDYAFARAYAQPKAVRNYDLAKKIGNDYISYMQNKIQYFEGRTRARFGRDIRQECLKNGYRFVSMDRALEDQVYRTLVTVFGRWGISWIDRWALSMGKTSDFFKGEPDLPDYIK